jgi:hypothetical protein
MSVSYKDQNSIGRRIVLWPAEAVVTLYVVLDDVLTPVFEPVVRWVAALPLILRLQKFAADLSPYGVLFLLLVPSFIGEPGKVWGLYLLATGHWVSGLIVLAASYAVTLILVERIYTAGKAKLMTIRWFAYLMEWMFAIRDHLHEWARSTWIWAYAENLASQTRLFYLKARERVLSVLEWFRLRQG